MLESGERGAANRNRANAFKAVAALRRLRAQSSPGEYSRAHAWVSSHDVRGFGVGTRDGLGIVQIFVERSARTDETLARIPARVRLPGVPDPVETHVIVHGPIRCSASPTPLGSEIGRGDQGWSGTAGCRVQWRGKPGTYLLSNAHVLAMTGLNTPSSGDPIIHPSFGNGGRAPGDTIAELANWVRLVPGTNFPNFIDAAIARITDEAAVAALTDIAQPTGLNPLITDRMPVRFFGAASQRVQSGIVTGTGVSVAIRYPQPDAPSQDFGFQGLAYCSAPVTDGDSGSIVVDADNLAVGLLLGGTNELGIFAPMDLVLNTLNLRLDVSPNAATRAGAVIIPAASALGFVPEVEHLYSAVDILARTLFGEVIDLEDSQISAVAAVVANRTHAQQVAWGLTVEAVCKGAVFRIWNPQTPVERAKLAEVNSVGREDTGFAQCFAVAQRTLNGDLSDPTQGATGYFNANEPTPPWAQGAQPTLTLGARVFVRARP
jgi:Cell Wall Hydrolase